MMADAENGVDRPIPRYIRRVFKSKSRKKIEKVLTRARAEGYTRDEILREFKKKLREFQRTGA